MQHLKLYFSHYAFQTGMRLIHLSRLQFLNQRPSTKVAKKNLTELRNTAIVIITFSKRFNDYALPLIKAIRKFEPDLPIYVGINGDLNEKYDTELRRNFLLQLANLNNVNPVSFGSFQGLSFMWNRTIQSTGAENILVLNDDLLVDGNYLNSTIELLVEATQKFGICILNKSWSHFGISLKVCSEVGWFDERLLGIGYEDSDFTYRYEELYGESIRSVLGQGFINDSSLIFDSNLSRGKGKYSLFNWAYIECKYRFGEGRKSRMFSELASRNYKEVKQFQNHEWTNELSEMRTETDKRIIEEKIRIAFEKYNSS